MKVPVTILLLLVSYYSGYSQVLLSGKVLESETKQPIPYANMGILNTAIGTISNEDGTFSIRVPAQLMNDSLRFSSIGYAEKSLAISALTDAADLTIHLEDRVLALDAIEIVAQQPKKKTVVLGNGKSLLLSGQLYCDTVSAGSAMALLIDKKENENVDYLNNASLYIAKNLSDEFKVRLRIMSVDPTTQQPGQDLIHDQLIEVSTIKKGWLDFEINQNCLIKDDAFFVVFEWIMDQEDREYVTRKYEEFIQEFPERVSYDTVMVDNEKVSIPKVSTVVAGTVFGVTTSRKDLEKYTCFYRNNSYGEWKRSSGILSARVTLANYPPSNTLITPAETQSKNPPFDDPIEAWMEKFRKDYSLVGLQLSVGRNNETIFSGGCGYADLSVNKEVNSFTQFRIASVSKTQTAAAIMQLSAKGLLHLDSAIQHYVPSFPVKKYPITVRQLVSHMAGIRHYEGKSWDEIFIQKPYNNLSDALELFQDDALVEKPGTRFLYSSYGYILLGAAIEHITGQSYLAYMKQHVWDLLRMNATYGEVADSLFTDKAQFYFLSGEEATPYNLSYSYSTGGLISTANDLVNFGLALTQDQFFPQEIKEHIFTSQYTIDQHPTGYGLGWFIDQDSQNQPVWYHTGELPSSGSLLVIFPEKKIVIALLSNSPIVSDSGDNFLVEVQRLVKIVDNY